MLSLRKSENGSGLPRKLREFKRLRFMMHKELAEGLFLGVIIGLVALAIHGLAGGASIAIQLLALLLAGIVLSSIQIVLSLRRSHRHHQPPSQPIMPHRPLIRRRMNRQTPFIQELTRNWTGLDDHLPLERTIPAATLDPKAEEGLEQPAERER